MSPAPVEILFFQVGAHVYASAVHDVVRIGSVRENPPEDLVLETALGSPFSQERGIVVAVGEGERMLVVDQVLGVRTVAAEDLRPLPAFAAACIVSGALAGLVLLDEVPTPLIDLSTLVHEGAGRAQAAALPS
jgi:chemotaxis signal transduction protein